MENNPNPVVAYEINYEKFDEQRVDLPAPKKLVMQPEETDKIRAFITENQEVLKQEDAYQIGSLAYKYSEYYNIKPELSP